MRKAKDLFAPTGSCTEQLKKIETGELTAEEGRVAIIHELNEYFCPGGREMQTAGMPEPTFPD